MLSLKLFRWALGSMKLVPPHCFPGGKDTSWLLATQSPLI